MQPEGTTDKHKPGKPPDHEHETTIVVNAQEKTVTTKEITFEQVVDLAYDGNPPQAENWVFTVTYRGCSPSPTAGGPTSRRRAPWSSAPA